MLQLGRSTEFFVMVGLINVINAWCGSGTSICELVLEFTLGTYTAGTQYTAGTLNFRENT